jgi:hypothetical protein
VLRHVEAKQIKPRDEFYHVPLFSIANFFGTGGNGCGRPDGNHSVYTEGLDLIVGDYELDLDVAGTLREGLGYALQTRDRGNVDLMSDEIGIEDEILAVLCLFGFKSAHVVGRILRCESDPRGIGNQFRVLSAVLQLYKKSCCGGGVDGTTCYYGFNDLNLTGTYDLNSWSNARVEKILMHAAHRIINETGK